MLRFNRIVLNGDLHVNPSFLTTFIKAKITLPFVFLYTMGKSSIRFITDFAKKGEVRYFHHRYILADHMRMIQKRLVRSSCGQMRPNLKFLGIDSTRCVWRKKNDWVSLKGGRYEGEKI